MRGHCRAPVTWARPATMACWLQMLTEGKASWYPAVSGLATSLRTAKQQGGAATSGAGRQADRQTNQHTNRGVSTSAVHWTDTAHIQHSGIGTSLVTLVTLTWMVFISVRQIYLHYHAIIERTERGNRERNAGTIQGAGHMNGSQQQTAWPGYNSGPWSGSREQKGGVRGGGYGCGPLEQVWERPWAGCRSGPGERGTRHRHENNVDFALSTLPSRCGGKRATLVTLLHRPLYTERSVIAIIKKRKLFPLLSCTIKLFMRSSNVDVHHRIDAPRLVHDERSSLDSSINDSCLHIGLLCV